MTIPISHHKPRVRTLAADLASTARRALQRSVEGTLPRQLLELRAAVAKARETRPQGLDEELAHALAAEARGLMMNAIRMIGSRHVEEDAREVARMVRAEARALARELELEAITKGVTA